MFGSLKISLVTDCGGHCGNGCSPPSDPHSQGEEHRRPEHFQAHRWEHFCANCTRIPCSVGNITGFIPSPAQAKHHDVVGTLPISYCELQHPGPHLHFWLLRSWSHFRKQPTIQIGVPCPAAPLPVIPLMESCFAKACVSAMRRRCMRGQQAPEAKSQ